MSLFSERFGFTAPKTELSESQMPESLRSGLWDAARSCFFADVARYDFIGNVEGYTQDFDDVSHFLWYHFFRKPTDTRPSDPNNARLKIREIFLKSKFHYVYDLIEFLANSPAGNRNQVGESFCEICNVLFSRELAAFRFAGKTLVKITDESEREEIENSITKNSATPVRTHIQRAAELYSQRPEPDYRNSIKESISAVESAVQFVTGKKTFGVGRPLKNVADEFKIHPALRDGFEKLYAFTSDAEGIRHALLNEQGLSQEDARYMLVSCSAFANYLVALKAKQNS